ncbi:MAG: hypothetical protein RLZZ203_742 [Cyanobacteriota bacterium]|jgi:hypothetical protein
MPNRKQIAQEIGVGERQLQRYIKLASQYLDMFASFRDKTTNNLIGMPVENDEQIQILKAIRTLILKYKNTKNRAEIIATELQKINKGDSNV